MDVITQEKDEILPEHLTRLEETVLEEFSLREKNYSFRFNGLRRLLKDVHQQKLSRALERLQEDQLIEQFPDGGYGLGGKYYDSIKEYFGIHKSYIDYLNVNAGYKHVYEVFSTENEFPIQDLVKKLKGKYFGAFRFVGHYYTNGKGRLEWIHAEDHSKILIASITLSKIEIVAFNIPKINIKKFLLIVQQLLTEFQIVMKFVETLMSQAN